MCGCPPPPPPFFSLSLFVLSPLPSPREVEKREGCSLTGLRRGARPLVVEEGELVSPALQFYIAFGASAISNPVLSVLVQSKDCSERIKPCHD